VYQGCERHVLDDIVNPTLVENQTPREIAKEPVVLDQNVDVHETISGSDHGFIAGLDTTTRSDSPDGRGMPPASRRFQQSERKGVCLDSATYPPLSCPPDERSRPRALSKRAPMEALTRISLAIDRWNRAIGRATAWLTLVMVLVGAYNAVARYLDPYRDSLARLLPFLEGFLEDPFSSNAYLETQWYLFSLVFLLGAPYALRCGAHVRVDVLYGNVSERTKAWIDLVGGVVFLVPFCAFAIWASQEFVLDSWDVREVSPDPGGLTRWPLKMIVPLAFFLLAMQGVSEVLKRILFLRGATPAAIGLVEPGFKSREGGA